MASRPRPATAASAFWQLAVIRRADRAAPVRLRARALPAERLRAEPDDALRTLTPLVLRTGRRAEGARARGGLDQLRAAVALLADEDPGLRGNAESAVRLRRWVHEVPARNAEVGELLDACAHLFSDYVMASTRRRVGLPG
ncbi:hypothetical protein ACWGRF_29350 [Streptomyces zhihengii]